MGKLVQSQLCLGTRVTIQVVSTRPKDEVDIQMEQAFSAIRFVEQVCSRFDEESPVRRLTAQVGNPVTVPVILFEAIRFALQVSALTGGAFDPTVGQVMEKHGFNRHYLTGQEVELAFQVEESVSYRDVVIDEPHRTVLLLKPLVLDLGAVAKGLAVDLAAKELSDCEGFSIDAGGDILVRGQNPQQEPWRVGIAHPLRKGDTLVSLQVPDMAVCTSGNYERVSPLDETIHHLLDPRSGTLPSDVLSSTVLAPYAMLADAFSTAAFILGREKGLQLLEDVGLQGVLITPSLDLHMTSQMERYIYARTNN